MYRHLRNNIVKIIVKKEFVSILSHFLSFLPVYSLEKNHFKMKNENKIIITSRVDLTNI